jgi:hypothetical protein
VQRVDVLRYGGLSCIIALIICLIITHVVGKNRKKEAGGINIVASGENMIELMREFTEGLPEAHGKVGRQNAMSVEELKNKLVERVRKLNIGYGPGIFIVPDESEEEADKRKLALSGVMAVPDGAVLEIGQIGGKLGLDGYNQMPLSSETTFTPKKMDDVKGAELTGYSFSGTKIESNNRPVGYTSDRTG